METRTRREFLTTVGQGMLVVSIGPTLAFDLGLAPAAAAEEEARLEFGSLEPLARLMEDTPADRLLPLLVSRLKTGTDLRQLVAAGALANARTFGGQNYIGFHALMALPPAYEMARELPKERQALPVLKVIYRNSDNIQKAGEGKETLRSLHVEGGVEAGAENLHAAMRRGEMDSAERSFAALARRGPEAAFADLQPLVEDDIDVHRVVLAYRAWALLDFTGREHAHSLLRQSVRYCVDVEQRRKERHQPDPAIREALPRLLEAHRLLSREPGTRRPDAGWTTELMRIVLLEERQRAAEAVAAALAEGIDPEAVGEAISLAATQLVLRDPGRRPEQVSPGKPAGSVHGDSVGVHASDAANAWRHIARVSRGRNRMASLVVGAYHTAGQAGRVNSQPYPLSEQLEQVKATDPAGLLRELDAAIREKDQFRACAVVTRYGAVNGDSRPLLDILLRYGTSEDGALHAEKYYRTVTEEFARSRPEFRWSHVAALARVTASEYGRPAPGYADACRLLGV
jgi:hypothetical protein